MYSSLFQNYSLQVYNICIPIILWNIHSRYLLPSFCIQNCKLRNILCYIYRVSQEERTKLRESVPYVELYRYNPKHLYTKLNGYLDNGQRILKL